MTGQRAETWRRFNFSTLPPGIGALAFFHVGHLAIHLAQRKAIGYLPLTKASDRRVAVRGTAGLLVAALGLVSWLIAVVIEYTTNEHPGAVGAFGILGFLAMPLAVFFNIAESRAIGPQGTVVDGLSTPAGWVVEMWNLHPDFVAATKEMYAQRLAQLTD